MFKAIDLELTTFGAFSSWNIKASNQNQLRLQADAYHNTLNATMTMYPENGSPMLMYTLAVPVRGAIGLNVSENILITNNLLLALRLRMEYMHDHLGTAAGKAQLSGMFLGGLPVADSFQI